MFKHTRSAPPPGAETNEFVMSDATVDRMGDVIEQDGWQLKNFKKNPLALFNHDSDQVIGRWADVAVRDGKLIGRLELAEQGTSPLVDAVRSLVRQKILRAVSVGFSALSKEPLTDDADKYSGPFRFLKAELLEASIVSIPANPNALAIAKGLPRDVFAEIFRVPAGEDFDRSAADHRVPAKPLVTKKATIMQTLGQKIQAAQQHLTALRDRLTELDKKEELDADEQKQLNEELPDEIEATQAEIVRLERREKLMAPRPGNEPQLRVGTVELVATDETRRVFAVPKKQEKPEDFLVRAVGIIAASASRRENMLSVFNGIPNAGSINDPQNPNAILLKAVTAPALTTATGWAAELMPTVTQGFLDRLLTGSIYGPLSGRGSRFTFDRAGKIRIPTRSGALASRLSGGWIGEAAAKPVKAGAFTVVELLPYKLAVISVFSEEIGEHSQPAIDQIIRVAMRDDTSTLIDSSLIDNTAGSATRPAGLLNATAWGTVTVTPSALTNKTEAMIADIKSLRQAIITNNGGRDIVLIMNSAQSTGIDMALTSNGLLFNGAQEGASRFGVGLVVSNTVTAGQVIAVDAAEFASATGDVPRYALSGDATLHMDDAATALSATGTPNTVAAPMRSLFQTDTIAIRMTWPISWAMLRSGMVATVNPVVW